MEYLVPCAFLIIGFGILILGGEWLVKGSVSLAARLKVSPTIIGLTIIAAGTSAPELVTSLLASLKDAPDIAVGNVVGSNIFNILAILGLASLVKPNIVDRDLFRVQIPLLVFFSACLLYFIDDFMLNRLESGIFIGLLILFILFSIYRSKKMTMNEEEQASDLLKNVWYDLAHLLLGFIFLLGGAHLTLEGGIQIGTLIGLSERVIGITIISVGTGLPELATSFVAAYRGRNDIAVSNVIGSNVMNTLGVLGFAGAVKPLKVDSNIAETDTVLMLVITAALVPLIGIGRLKIHRSAGSLLLFCYIGYIVYLLNFN